MKKLIAESYWAASVFNFSIFVVVSSLALASVKTNIGEPGRGLALNASSMPVIESSGQSAPPVTGNDFMAVMKSYLFDSFLYVIGPYPKANHDIVYIYSTSS